VRHPAAMAEAEINTFLTHLAVKEKVSASRRTRRSAPCSSSTVTFWTVRSAISVR
jgi:hypothetical protein